MTQDESYTKKLVKSLREEAAACEVYSRVKETTGDKVQSECFGVLSRKLTAAADEIDRLREFEWMYGQLSR